ncbi:unnamed protein product [Acanthoscelides obtectus]|uniref:Uncharacterized protein n=1 Tax=Acanthoscelides obtectus TaxID=200917 RepID=A0A9P0JJW3_ACAOB|nr:unnamed protein product [Acanthoscelides obtectus]CAK1639703.1 hypothetical protein AOBTE_LOCUS11323 [Acanthoscelides obtectus]
MCEYPRALRCTLKILCFSKVSEERRRFLLKQIKQKIHNCYYRYYASYLTKSTTKVSLITIHLTPTLKNTTIAVAAKIR